jgi:hypothetical protein
MLEQAALREQSSASTSQPPGTPAASTATSQPNPPASRETLAAVKTPRQQRAASPRSGRFSRRSSQPTTRPIATTGCNALRSSSAISPNSASSTSAAASTSTDAPPSIPSVMTGEDARQGPPRQLALFIAAIAARPHTSRRGSAAPQHEDTNIRASC